MRNANVSQTNIHTHTGRLHLRFISCGREKINWLNFNIFHGQSEADKTMKQTNEKREFLRQFNQIKFDKAKIPNIVIRRDEWERKTSEFVWKQTIKLPSFRVEFFFFANGLALVNGIKTNEKSKISNSFDYQFILIGIDNNEKQRMWETKQRFFESVKSISRHFRRA